MMLKEDSVRVNKVLTHYWSAGVASAQTILLVHGGFGHAWVNWSGILPALGEDYYVIAPDLPGYGQTDALPEMTIAALLEWLKGLMQVLNIEQAALVGHSYGALLARLLAANNPKQVPALIMADGGVIPGVSSVARTIAGLPVVGGLLFNRISSGALSRGSLEDILGNKAVLSETVFQQMKANASGLTGLMRALTVASLPENRTPRVPVLIVWGEQDTFAPPSTAETIKDNIPGARVALIADCGHMPHLEAPEVFTFQVTNFLYELNRSRRMN